MAALRRPEVRKQLLDGSRSPDAGVFARVADFPNFRIGQTHTAANAGLTGRLVREIAGERGTEPFDTLLDIVLEEEDVAALPPAAPAAAAPAFAAAPAAFAPPTPGPDCATASYPCHLLLFRFFRYFPLMIKRQTICLIFDINLD